MTVLNLSIRPLLSKWHPLLTAHEALRAKGSDPVSHERQWEHAPELRAEIERVRHALADLADVLREVAGVGDLVTPLVSD